MLSACNAYLEYWEPFWLFTLIFLEFLACFYSCIILTIEYFYDKEQDKRKKRKVVRKGRKVKIIIEDGQARIEEQPKDVDVEIKTTGE